MNVRFDDSNISGVTQLKSTVQKAIKAKLVQQFPNLTEYVDEILPKKEAIKTLKWFVFLSKHYSIFIINEIMFVLKS